MPKKDKVQNTAEEIKQESVLKDKDLKIKNFKEDIDKYIKEKINESYAKDQLFKAIDNRFSNKTIIYLTKKFNKISTPDYIVNNNGYIDTCKLFNDLCEEIKEMDTQDASCILFDLFNFYDFRGYMASYYPVMSNIIKKYKNYDDNVIGNGIYMGSSIIARLFDNKCQKIIFNHITELAKQENVPLSHIQMIGGGGSSLVFKIGDKVIKFGETRHCRKICVNHRILASLYRKLEKDENNNDLFYVEVMKYIKTGVTPEERDELKNDLAKQGIIWDDDKLENCGYLPEGYDNYCPISDNYEEVLANIDNPLYRENFNRQRKRVVVLDSDNMRLDTTKLQKY